jgi:putative nucleotidyltransferase with HDIG domain
MASAISRPRLAALRRHRRARRTRSPLPLAAVSRLVRCCIEPRGWPETSAFDRAGASEESSGLSFLQRFAAVSLIATVVLGILFGEIAARIATDYALRRQAQAFAVYVSEFAAPRLVSKDFFQPPPAARPQFEFTLRSLIGKANIVHVTVTNRNGEVIYSDEESQIGKVQPIAGPLQQSLKGTLTWRFTQPNGEPGEGYRRMEVFVPVVVEADSRPVAVYHVVSDLADLEPTLIRLTWIMRASVVVGVLLLYLTLYTIVRQASRNLEHQKSALHHAFMGIVRSLANAMDVRDTPTMDHSTRVAEHCEAIARDMNLDDDLVSELQVAALLHDVGKIGIRDEILLKKGALTPEEREVMRRHTILGYEILAPVPISDGIKLAVRHSHERWDGTGYPDGLAGEEIPIVARILAVADSYQAIVTDRPYRRAVSPLRALEEIQRCAGSQFDPQVVASFLRIMRRRILRPARSAHRRADHRDLVKRIAARTGALFSEPTRNGQNGRTTKPAEPSLEPHD